MASKLAIIAIDSIDISMLAEWENWCRTPPAFLPVEPVASCGSRSINTTFVMPRCAKCHATLQPMQPPPTITTSAVVFI